ncbi:MAG: GntR family transcriptional regulator [Lachnospiraceae bacterium]|nr:GntR family transcriptional regulator [Lachnospiraceae bacterium]
MININYMSRTPVYEQIIEQIENYVLVGIYKSGDKLQSVRSLSIELSINPNTIQKAYSELDRRGITSSVPGRGSFISENALSILKEHGRNMLSQLTELLERLIIAGIGYDEIIACVDDAFKQKD